MARVKYVTAPAYSLRARQMLPRASSGRTSFGSFRREPFQNGLGVIGLLERIEIEGLANVDGALQRRPLRDLVIGRDRVVVALHSFLSVGKRGKSKSVVGLGVEGELQIDRSEADTAFSGSASPSP